VHLRRVTLADAREVAPTPAYPDCRGMACSPCPLITAATCGAGYFPPFFCARSVRSVGGVFIAGAAGPLPLASFPWQTAQSLLNIS
jgi:hypothetical protein